MFFFYQKLKITKEKVVFSYLSMCSLMGSLTFIYPVKVASLNTSTAADKKTHNCLQIHLRLNLVSEAYEREDVPLCKIRWMTTKINYKYSRISDEKTPATDWETPNGSPIINNWWSNQGEDHSKIAFRKKQHNLKRYQKTKIEMIMKQRSLGNWGDYFTDLNSPPRTAWIELQY